ncbi:male-enhanced antigen 1 isoform X3 [Gouania willdenowi]|uniref:male-enhanced antigen 1 isoform X3 n=1 Tax=Gouania willdenowi TaxID=441366 RepID=UPI00105661ED|nr:male-enhanced antigen 1 isoform X3 [Gouania willdenowi]
MKTDTLHLCRKGPETSSGAMERVLPTCEEELQGDDRPSEGVAVPQEEEPEEEEGPDGGYYYQPLTQEPIEGPTDQDVQQRIQVMGLYLPEAPPIDSDDDDDEAQRSRASIPMDAERVELVKRTMALVALPSIGVPHWAKDLSEDQWEDMVRHTLQRHQERHNNSP